MPTPRTVGNAGTTRLGQGVELRQRSNQITSTIRTAEFSVWPEGNE